MGRLSVAISLVIVLLTSSIITGCAVLFPDVAQRHVNQGLELYRQGRLDEAIYEYTEAIRLNPQYAMAYYNRGLAEYRSIDRLCQK